jgi:hypothetical protein
MCGKEHTTMSEPTTVPRPDVERDATRCQVLNLRAQTLDWAALIIGLDALAEDLGVTPAMLAVLVRGAARVPPEMFLRAMEIITDAAVSDAAKRRVSPNMNAGNH